MSSCFSQGLISHCNRRRNPMDYIGKTRVSETKADVLPRLTESNDEEDDTHSRRGETSVTDTDHVPATPGMPSGEG